MSKKWVVIISFALLIIFGVTAFMIVRGGRKSIQNAESETSTSLAPTSPSDQIVGTTWIWRETKMSDDTTFSTDEDDSFSVTLSTDGVAKFTTDCNNGNGTYTLGENNAITFGPIASTMMYCEGSSETDFYRQIGQVSSYFVKDGRLFLELKLDSGTMEFNPS